MTTPIQTLLIELISVVIILELICFIIICFSVLHILDQHKKEKGVEDDY